jgi:hypothetical protein
MNEDLWRHASREGGKSRRLDRMMRSFVGVAGLTLASCGLLSPSETLRYKVTVEVQTPDGVRTGSSVWEVSTSEGPGLPRPESSGLVHKVRAEAVVVELQEGKLFALVASPNGDTAYPESVFSRHFATEPYTGLQLTQYWRENIRLIKAANIAFDLSHDQLPLLAAFVDPNDPATVETVSPEDLSSHFGSGVTLRRIHISVTNAPPTSSLKMQVPWLSRYEHGGLLRGPSAGATAPYISAVHFRNWN